MQLDEAAHILGAADFFSICDLEQRRMLAFGSDRQVLKAGDVLFRIGDVTPGAYVLISGSLMSRDKHPKDEGAHSVEIDQPGTVIGELAMIAKHPRRSTVTAKTDVELLLVPRETFSKLMQQFPDLAAKAAAKVQGDLQTYIGSVKSMGQKFSSK